jgi:aspartyl-tRNA(Asn)/glutamyl-tRNA(Gln) amidotransferase subunit B
MTAQYLGASDCKLQEGSMRADVNISVRETGTETLGTRTEMKNLNSFKAIVHAIDGERKRQIERIEDGLTVTQETRRWDDNKESSKAMRSKEDAKDYRYFPDPDLVPISVDKEWIQKIRAAQPELAPEKMARYQSEFGLPEYDASILTSSKHMADLFEQTVKECGKPKEASNWLMVEGMRMCRETETDAEGMKFSPENLSKLIKMVDGGTINRTTGKVIFEEIFKNNVDPEQYAAGHGMKAVTDDGALEREVSEVIRRNPQSVADYKSGKQKAMGFLIGQVMKSTKGMADPKELNRIVRKMLDEA